MLQAIRKNPLIAASVALPLLLVLVFSLAGLVPRFLVSDPGYDLVLSQYDPEASDFYAIAVDIVVRDGEVVARVARNENSVPRGRPRVYIYEHETGSILEAMIDWPDDTSAVEEGAILGIPDLSGRKVTTLRRAPDGYEYRGIDYRHGFLFGFFGGRRADQVTIGKSGAIVPIDLPDSSRYGYGSVRFIGWIVERIE